MLSLILVVFIIQLSIHALSIVGSDVINVALWELYSKTPVAPSSRIAAVNTLRKEVLALNKEMNNTSAQDDFAKWAKLRRQHDKKKEEYDKQSQAIKDAQTKFNRSAGIARWILTTGVRYALQWWFGKQAMFYLPKGWVPYAAEWVLSFPSAPLGGISINMWWIACASVIAMVSEAASTVWSVANGTSNPSQKPVPQAQPASSAGKKEL